MSGIKSIGSRKKAIPPRIITINMTIMVKMGRWTANRESFTDALREAFLLPLGAGEVVSVVLRAT